YDEKGKRTKDKKILAGKAVGCYSMINYVGDKPYIMIGQNKYVAYMNVVGLDCQLNHNSYIYSRLGKRIPENPPAADDQQVYQEVSPPAFRGGCRKKHPWSSGECLIRDA
ncbi:SLAP domain-containing protein, partial [Lactobacillus delbrueckii]|uniref:SLAP domain-containing protein n=1 Tax=Lactobacillus delbrueckii TaxID=1584 RepID=UPI002552A9B8